jgi:hypothetical protein
MSQPRETGYARTALPSRPVQSTSYSHVPQPLKPASSQSRERNLLPHPRDDQSVSPEPRDSIMSDVHSISSKASSPDSHTGDSAGKLNRATSAVAPSGQICRYGSLAFPYVCKHNLTHSVIAAQHRRHSGEDRRREQQYAMHVDCTRRPATLLALPV